MRSLFLTLIVLASAGAAKADCLEEIGKFREQVDFAKSDAADSAIAGGGQGASEA